MGLPLKNPTDFNGREFVRPAQQYYLCQLLNEDEVGLINSFLSYPDPDARWDFKFKFHHIKRDRNFVLQIALRKYFENSFNGGESNLRFIGTLDALEMVDDFLNTFCGKEQRKRISITGLQIFLFQCHKFEFVGNDLNFI
jgi:hypothetical protein